MDDLLVLIHRIPWPPNKGDKIRSHHLLRYLAKRYRVHLGTFIDDPDDERYLPALEALCTSLHAAPLEPRSARLRALTGLFNAQPLSLPYYRDRGMTRWVRQQLETHAIERAVVFSSPMAQYLEPFPAVRRVVDLVDVDSDKWRQYARDRSWLGRLVYAREARRLLAFERRAARAASATLLVSEAEADLFRRLAPETAARIHAVHNGVDTDWFDPGQAGETPYAEGVRPLVFTGAMDYWPNEEAVTWFVQTILPRIREVIPEAGLYIVGNHPTRGVQALATYPGVVVTGFVEDMRPWLGHAEVAVAPLRIARGVQNKVLEAMAMGRTVMATGEALAGIEARVGEEVLQADGAEAFVRTVLASLRTPDVALGKRARARIVGAYGWDARLEPLDRLMEEGDATATEGCYGH